MNIAFSEACNQASDAEKDKIEIRQAIPIVPESIVESERTDKNKDEFISVTYMCLNQGWSVHNGTNIPSSIIYTYKD